MEKREDIDNYMRTVMKDGHRQAWTDKNENLHKKAREEEEEEDESLQRRVANFAGSFSAHGIGKVFLSRHWWRRVLWLAVCLVMAGWGTYQCYSIVTEYFQYPKKVTIEIIEETKVPFPAVTVCNLNPLPARSSVADHQTWSSFVQIEDENSEAICEGFSTYQNDYYDYYDYYGEPYSGSYSGDFWDRDSTGTGYGGYNYYYTGDSSTSSSTSSTPWGASSESTSSTPWGASSESTSSTPWGASSESTSSTPWGASETTDDMMGTNRKRRSLEEMETTRQRSMPNLRQGREDTRAWMSREPKMRRERNEESGVNGDEERREKNPLGRGVNAQGVKKLQERHENRTSSREKRNAIWSFLFGDEEEEEDEEEEMEVVTSGNRAIPFPASPKSEAVDYKTFIKMYQHVFEEDEDLPRVRRAAADEVQDEDVVGGNGGLNDLGLIKNIRSKCSTYFLYFLIQEKERNFVEDDEDTYVDLKTVGSDCPQDDYRETITFNPICNLEVVCDNYGCFDYFLRDFKEKVNETHRCPSCAKEECWLKIWLEHYEKGYLDIEQVSAIFSASRTADFSDMLGVYSPSKDDIGKFSMPAKEFIKSCSYDRRPCNHKQFFSWTSDQFGQCYTFNSAFRKVQHKSKTVYVRVKSTTSTGPMNGLRLSLNINANEYVSLLSPDIGVRVIVHSPHQLPFPEEEGFNVSPGDSVSVSVSRKVIQRVGYPHGRCRNESGSSIYKEYTSIGCKKLCLEEEYWRECGCYVGKSPVYHRDMQPLVRPDIPCSPFNVRQKLCMEMVQYSYLKGKLTCPCPPACKETVFMPQATVSRGNQKFFTILQNLKKTMVDDSLCNDNSNNSDPVRLHFYMDSLSYEKIEESPAFTWNTLVCNVGGNLGLFLGMSIVTLVELLEFLIDLLFSCCNFRKSDATRGGGGGGRGSSPVIAPPEARPAPPPPHQPQDSQWWERENYSSPRRVASAAFNRIFLGE